MVVHKGVWPLSRQFQRKFMGRVRPWCVGGGFNVLRFPYERSREGRLSQVMRRFSQIDDLDLKDLPT